MKGITSSRLPLKYCSTDSRVVRHRTMSMNDNKGCPQGTRYLCGKDSTKSFLIEACEAYLICLPGTTHQFVVNLLHMTFELKCLPCDPDRFEPELSNSSRFSRLPGCTYQHKPSKNISQNLVLFEQGTASRATLWYCDIENGYYEEDGNMFCDDVQTKPCHCVKKTCPMGYLLSTNGSCVRCNSKLDPYNSFQCQQKNSSRNNGKLSHRTRRPPLSENANLQQNNLVDGKDGDFSVPSTARTTSEKEPEDVTYTWIVVVIVAGIVLGGAVLGILWRYHNLICCCMYPSRSTADQNILEEQPYHNYNHTMEANDTQEEHRTAPIINGPTVNNSTTSNGQVITNPSDDRDLVSNPNRQHQPEFKINPSQGDENSRQYASNLRMVELKPPNNEGSVERGSFDRSESSEGEPLHLRLNLMEDSGYATQPNLQQQDSREIEEDGDDDAEENDSLLSEQGQCSQTYRKQEIDES